MQLDQQQLEIINSTASNIIVVAGAGSGKTAVLTERIRHLILDRGVSPADIVAITFTNMAAEEMLERMQDIPDIEQAFVGTIHSFANKILHEAGLWYDLLTDEMHIRLCHELIQKYAQTLTIDRYDEFHDMASKVRYGLYTKAEVNAFFTPEEKAEYKGIYEECPKTFPESIPDICEKRGIITFDQLLWYAKQSMMQNHKTIKYCLVDEFQDVGDLEDNFISSLEAESYFLVGDDWQSIYKFKGANVEIFKSRIRSDDWKTYYMTNNYRCAKSIINIAERVISSVEDRIKKKTTPVRNMQGSVVIKPRKQLNDWLNVIKTIGEWGSWFFLARTNADCQKLYTACLKHGISAVMVKQGDGNLNALLETLGSDTVKILTVHSAKGLQSKRVMLYGNFQVETTKDDQKDYHFKRRKIKNTEDFDEERRVMYVGVTRAEDHLLILN